MPGDSSIRDPDLKRLRALRFIEERIKGKSNKEIAEAFGVSEDTVIRNLSWAKKSELVVQAEDRILRDLLPAAEKAIADVFNGTDDEVKAKTALEIFKGTLPSFSKRPSASGATSDDSSGGLSSYIAKLRDQAALADGAVDGEVVSSSPALEGSPQRLITAGAEENTPHGVSTPAESDGSAAESPGDPSPR